MIEDSIFIKLADYSSLTSEDRVLDIGAGLGILSRFLSSRCRTVTVVEADSGLVRFLHEQMKNVSNLQVIEGSIFTVELPQFNKIVSIPPYQISSHLVSWLLGKDFESAVLIFQREFAEKLTAPVGTENYGWLTVLGYFHFSIDLLDVIPKEMFYPVPNIDSTIVRLIRRKHPPFSVKDLNMFRRLVQISFTERNRKVRNAMISYMKGVMGLPDQDAKRLAQSMPFNNLRVRNLTPENFGALADVLVT